MIRINLLAESKGGKRGAAKAAGPSVTAEGAPNLLPHIALIIVLLLIPVAYSAWLYMQNTSKEQEIQEKQKELERYKGAREKVQELEKTTAEYADKVAQIKDLKTQQSLPVKVMNSLVDVLPEGAWYTKLTQKGDGIQMEGKARSIKTISTLSDQLVATRDITGVEMGDISQETVGTDTIYSYKVKFKYHPGGANPQDAADKTAAGAPAAGKK